MLRHPGEPYLPLVGAALAFRWREESPVPWLQRALERSQRNGRAHLLLADVLAARGVMGQALLELRLAMQDEPELVAAAARKAVRWTRAYDELAKVVPDGPLGARALTAFAEQLLRRGEETLRLRCAREAAAREPGAMGARFAAADVLLGALAQDVPPGLCTGALRSACAEEVQAHAVAIELLDRASPHPVALRARLLLSEGEGRASEAEAMLAAECARVNEAISCLRLRVQAAAAMKTGARLTAAAKDLLTAACSAASPCAEVATWLGDLMARRQEWGTAVTHYERALSEEPRPERWVKLGEAASRAGGHARALEAFQRALEGLGGQDDALKRRIAEERRRALDRLVVP
jgi:tetratricopeptide (TPR) repeat protein